MKKNTLLALLAFLVLLAAALWTLQRPPERGLTRVSLEHVDSETIDEIRISGPHPALLVKGLGGWTLGGRPVDPVAITRTLEALEHVESSDLVTRNPERFAELGVDDLTGARVELLVAGEKVAEFVAGRLGRHGHYYRFGDAVFSVQKVATHVFAKPRSDWYDLRLFQDSFADVRRVEVMLAGAAPYALVVENGAWRLAEDVALPARFRFGPETARNFVRALVTTRAQDVLEEGFDEAGADRFVLHLGDGTRRELTLANGEGYARVAHRADDVFLLAEETARPLRRHVGDLRDLQLARFDHRQATSLEIVDGDERILFEKQGGAWTIRTATPPDFELDPQSVSIRLEEIASAQARGVAPSDASLRTPSASVNVTHPEGKAFIRFGSGVAQGSTDEAAVFVIDDEMRHVLTGGLDTFAAQPEIDAERYYELPPDMREHVRDYMKKNALEFRDGQPARAGDQL